MENQQQQNNHRKEKIISIGMKVKFTPKGKKEQIEGEVLKFFIGTDKKTYCRIKVKDKIYSKQIDSLEEVTT